jgi:hypothetical protein
MYVDEGYNAAITAHLEDGVDAFVWCYGRYPGLLFCQKCENLDDRS